jgi:1-acyl-sn-glycerol-3-phosphate acyltransferase
VAKIRVFLKASGVIFATLLAVSVPLLVRMVTLNARGPVARIGSLASWLWSRSLCRILGIEVFATGRPEGDPFVVAANHISYVDILVLGSLYRSQFVAKEEIRGWPVFGWISRAAGTLFVNRRNPRDAVRVIRSIRAHLADGVSITLFPEGGTSPGDEVRPFLPTLLEPAAGAGVPCYAASLSYETPDSRVAPGETICWHDGSNFVKHFLGIMHVKRIEARVSFSEQPVRSSDRKELARKLWEDARGSFVPIRREVDSRRCAP